MKLQTQNAIYLVPLFVALALATSAIIGVLERDEISWGLQQESGSLAVCIAEFLGPGGLEAQCDQASGAPEADRRQAALDHILQQEQTKRVFGVATAGGTARFDVGPWAGGSLGPGDAGPDGGSPGGSAGSSAGGVTTRLLSNPGHGRVMRATAPVTNPDGSVVGLVGVEVSASALDQQRKAWMRQSIFRVLIALAAGVICSSLVSWVLRAQILSLGRAVEAAAQGEYSADQAISPGIIREIRDLVNTFRTMVSIFRGALARTRRNLLGFERFRTDQDLSQAIDTSWWLARESWRERSAVLVRGVGRLPRGAFYDLRDTSDRVYVWFGRAGEGSDLSAALSSSAAVSFLRRSLAAGKAEAVAMEAVALFGVRELTILEWAIADRLLGIYRLDPGSRSMTKENRSPRFSFGEVFHDLGEDVDTRLQLFLEAFPSASPTILVEEMMALLNTILPAPGGVFALVSTSAQGGPGLPTAANHGRVGLTQE